MLKQFFNSDVETDFIQAIINNFSFPIYNTVRDHDYIVNGAFYIYKTNIIKCTRTGYIQGKLDFNPKYVYKLGDVISGRGEYAEFEKISPYKFGETILNTTERHICNCNYYDPDTHKYLGDYLRALKNCLGLNLM